ncbi:MAG: hypothetical protein KAI47_19970, partial [Deltaproteobacteria bacterium]|nr:hypothetical protein [Deltaproteobacteria bacterium]
MIEDLTWTPDGNTLLWIKSRDGRNTIVEQALDDAGMPSAPPRHLPIAADVRGQIAYGGGAFAASDDAIFFTAREGLFRLPQDGGDPRPLLPIPGRVAAP